MRYLIFDRTSLPVHLGYAVYSIAIYVLFYARSLMLEVMIDVLLVPVPYTSMLHYVVVIVVVVDRCRYDAFIDAFVMLRRCYIYLLPHSLHTTVFDAITAHFVAMFTGYVTLPPTRLRDVTCRHYDYASLMGTAGLRCCH